MDNYDQMVTKNRKISEEKANRAITAMNKMFNNDEQVVVCELVKKTGLSRAFFYNNEDVHNELVRLQELQEGKSFVAKQKVVINKAMDKEIDLLTTNKDSLEKFAREEFHFASPGDDVYIEKN